MVFTLEYANQVLTEAQLITEFNDLIHGFLEERDKKFIESAKLQLSYSHYLTEKQKKYCRDILMKYSKNYKINKKIIIIEVNPNEILWAKEEISKFENSTKGQWRYEGVNAWRGLIGERLVYNWFKDEFEYIEKNKDLSEDDEFDEYDFMINGYKLDVKCATEWMHAAITPKVITCHNWPKDFYVGCKYDERCNPHRVLIMGWIRSEDLKKFPILKNKGTDYYEIPINELDDISLLIAILKNKI